MLSLLQCLVAESNNRNFGRQMQVRQADRPFLLMSLVKPERFPRGAEAARALDSSCSRRGKAVL